MLVRMPPPTGKVRPRRREASVLVHNYLRVCRREPAVGQDSARGSLCSQDSTAHMRQRHTPLHVSVQIHGTQARLHSAAHNVSPSSPRAPRADSPPPHISPPVPPSCHRGHHCPTGWPRPSAQRVLVPALSHQSAASNSCARSSAAVRRPLARREWSRARRPARPSQTGA
eukprot:6683199-Prymnesium_polylepis.1